uniref:Uncharacterized protein n=1 Tax=Pinctada fucata TaxID=50426 RepID=A0A194AKZ8_PINFU
MDFTNHGTSSNSDCPILSSIKTQKNFNLTKFMEGVWHTRTYNSFVDIPGMDINSYEHYDLKSRLRNTSNGIIIENAGIHKAKHGTGKCLRRNGTVKYEKNDPAKITLVYNFPHLKHEFSYWIRETDYKNYAVVYSCSANVRNNEKCTVDKSHLWTITRTPKTEYPKNKIEEQAKKELCVHGSHNNVTFPETCPLDEKGVHKH